MTEESGRTIELTTKSTPDQFWGYLTETYFKESDLNKDNLEKLQIWDLKKDTYKDLCDVLESDQVKPLLQEEWTHQGPEWPDNDRPVEKAVRETVINVLGEIRGRTRDRLNPKLHFTEYFPELSDDQVKTMHMMISFIDIYFKRKLPIVGYVPFS